MPPKKKHTKKTTKTTNTTSNNDLIVKDYGNKQIWKGKYTVHNIRINKENAEKNFVSIRELKAFYNQLKSKTKNQNIDVQIVAHTAIKEHRTLKVFDADDITYGDNYTGYGEWHDKDYDATLRNFIYVDFLVRYKN